MQDKSTVWVSTFVLAVTSFSIVNSGIAAGKGKEANQAYAQKQLAGLSAVPKFVPAGPAFDARKVMAGKSILSIPGPSSDPWYSHVVDGMKGAASDVPFSYSVWPNEGQMAQYQKGLESALTTKPSLIDLLAGPDPRAKELKPGIDAAKAAGIKVAVSHNFGIEDKVPNVDFNLPVDYNRAGRIMADWVITKDTKAHVLVLVSDEIPSEGATRRGITSEFDQHGGTDIKYNFVNVPIPDWGTKMKPAVESAIAADPSLDYVICIYDSMAKYVTAAITDAKAEGRVKVIGFNGTPFVLDLIREGKVEMTLGCSLGWTGYAIADAEMRILDGKGAVKSMNIPMRLFTKENAAEAGVPADFDKGYGDTFKNEYDKLWKLNARADGAKPKTKKK